jgi:4-amino-4-deoxy-L-arabinose transferase-like glycosyltransferase
LLTNQRMTLTGAQVTKIRKQVFWLIVITTLVRLFLASQVELANDEVYYWTYALYPDLSHFDHPPMVGFMAQLFTLNLFFTDDFFLRLGSIVLSAASTWTIFCIGRKVKNELAGLYAAFLYTSSIYCSIISGFSLIPDAPQVFFWLLCLNVALDILPTEKITNSQRRKMLLFGLFAGLAMLSKYHSVFIWVGILLFVLFQNRKWVVDYSLYLAGFISLLVFSPVLIWNIQNDFISFTFHGDRVAPAWELRPDYFLTELGGQIAYHNPLNIILIVIAMMAVWKGKNFIDSKYKGVLLFNAIPLWLLFTGFSLFRSTLPHWSGPAFLSLIVLTAAYWAERIGSQNLSEAKMIRPLRIMLSSYFLGFLMVVAFYSINYSSLQLGKQKEVKNFGEYDFTQDMYGYDQISNAFQKIVVREESQGSMAKGSDLISHQWFPGTHLDFYVAQPHYRNLFLIGSLNEIHKYAWINQQRGGLQKGKDYYHIAVSNYYKEITLRRLNPWIR